MKALLLLLAWVFLLVGVASLYCDAVVGPALFRDGFDPVSLGFVLFSLWYGVAAIAYSIAYLRSRSKARAYSLATLTAVTIWLLSNPFFRSLLHMDDHSQGVPKTLAALVLPILLGISTNAILKNLIDRSYATTNREPDASPAPPPRVSSSEAHE